MLGTLRKVMTERDIDCYIIPNADPHLGEYIPEYWQIIRWLTGFTGSAATVIVTDTFAGLWTDSRYFIQAEKQLVSSGFAVMRPLTGENKSYMDWLKENLHDNSNISFDGRLISIGQFRLLEKTLQGTEHEIDSQCDLITDLWTDRPAMPGSVAFDHHLSYCGKDRSVKIAELRNRMKEVKANYHLLTSIDDIMWLLNIRGADVQYSPLVISFCIVGEEQVLFFVDEDKIPPKLASEFDKLDIVMLPYEEVSGMLYALPDHSSILLTANTTSVALFSSISKGLNIIEDISIPTRMKAVKNSVEIANLEKTMVRDGIALTRFFYWMEHNAGSVPMSELSLSVKITSVRSEQENYLSPGFSPIVAYNEHSALPHFTASPEDDKVLGTEGILLVDSGSQYLDGTTDITRTISVGLPAAQQKRDYTLVLKGMINLTLVKFPYGTRGSQIDVLARQSLWDNGMNFGHGTGHGVGFCLNVHEGPQSIGPGRASDQPAFFEPGMVITNEPGIYREGKYGVRIENMLLCYEDEVTEFGKFLKFHTLSLCYIEKSLIDVTLLTQKEIDWLNNYHHEVFVRLNEFLSPEEKDWLKEKTSEI